MAAKLYTPGENAQEIFTDINGNRFDERGNQITGGPEQSLSRDAVCYRTERGQQLRYANVYPGPVNVHQNVPLSDFAIAYEVDNPRVGSIIAPVATVSKRSDVFYIIGQQGQETLRTPTDESDIRAVGGLANEVQDVFNTDTYTVVNYAYRDFLPDEVADNADEVLQMSQHITKFLTDKLEFRYDIRVLALLATLTQTATFATACGTGGKFIKDATATTRYINLAYNYAKTQIINNNAMKTPTHTVMGLDVAQAMSASPEVAPQIVYDIGRQYIEQGGMTGDALAGGLPATFNGLRPVVAYHPTNTAKKGQANSFSAYMSNLLYVLNVEGPGRRTNNTITTFRKGGIETRTYRDEGRRGMYVEVEMIQTEKVTNQYGGYKITAPIS